MSRDIVASANENYRHAFVRLATTLSDGETSEFGPLTAAASGLPAPLYNRLFVFTPPPRDEFAAAVSWLTDQDVPFWVTTTASDLAEVDALAADTGLARGDESNPGMVMSPLDDIPPNESAADITEVTSAAERAEFVTVASSVFGMARAVSEQVYRAAFETDGNHLLLGHVDGQAAGCGLLVRTGDVAGVYTIGVTEPFRRLGIGEAMSWAVLRAGRSHGCDVGALQSSAMAIPLYEQMGFETVVMYHHFVPEP